MKSRRIILPPCPCNNTCRCHVPRDNKTEALSTLFKCIDDHGWCVIVLLGEITKENPILEKNRGKYHEVINDWKKWGKEKGYL